MSAVVMSEVVVAVVIVISGDERLTKSRCCSNNTCTVSVPGTMSTVHTTSTRFSASFSHSKASCRRVVGFLLSELSASCCHVGGGGGGGLSLSRFFHRPDFFTGTVTKRKDFSTGEKYFSTGEKALSPTTPSHGA